MTVGHQSDFREETLKIGVWSWKVEHAEVVQLLKLSLRMFWNGRLMEEKALAEANSQALEKFKGRRNIRTVESRD